MVSVIILVIKLHVTEITSFLLNYIVVPLLDTKAKSSLLIVLQWFLSVYWPVVP